MMEAIDILHTHLMEECPFIHGKRLQAVMDVACSLQKKQNLSLTAIGKGLSGDVSLKHKIKKVDRLEGNKHLYEEIGAIYTGLSSFLFQYLAFQEDVPVLIDLCYLKDDHDIQMLSAEIALKGRSIPLYREVFRSGGLSGRAHSFLQGLMPCIPKNKTVIFIMDAGFGEDWLKAIESLGWFWLTRIRQGKMLKLGADEEWTTVKDFVPQISEKTKSYNQAFIMKDHNRACRVITTQRSPGEKRSLSRVPRNDKAGSNHYRRLAREPWILATNLPKETFNATKVVNYYSKRMQIEQSFRDVKSHQFGLSARYASTKSIYRWGVKMLLAAIVQLMFWIIGVIAHSQNYQRVFQANTVRDKKVFSYFYLGQLMVEFDKIHELVIDHENLPNLIEQELARKW
ncbi:IS4 family transposase [Legionella birminghamensis]|nr:IS4 family transposase [Legionella birminghamensis]